MSVPVGLIVCGGEDDPVVVLVGATIEGRVVTDANDGTGVAVDDGTVFA